jgi:hypothetical protein
MATHARSKKGTARFQQYIPLGVDERGAHHVVDYKTDTVHIIHPDGSRGRRLLDGGDVDDYMAAVADAHGWAHRTYGTSLVDMLTAVVDG